jgi:hypothetical protein
LQSSRSCWWRAWRTPSSSDHAPPPTAKAQYDKGVVAYNLQKFDDAIAAFTRAYEIDPAPILLFNIAQSHWKKGRERARPLLLPPLPRRRPQGRQPRQGGGPHPRARGGEQGEASAPAPLPAVTLPPPAAERTTPPVASLERPIPPPVEPTPIYRRPWFWGAVGGAVAAGVVAAFLLRPGESAWNCAKCVKTVEVP